MGNTTQDKTLEEKEFLENIGSIIKKKRLELGLKQYDLAYKANVADNLIVQIERVESVPSILTLYRICKILKIEIVV